MSQTQRRSIGTAAASARGLHDSAELVGEIVDLMLKTVRLLQSHFEACAAECGLAGAQAAAVQQLDRPLSMRDLASRLGCDPSNVTGITDRLEARALVERHAGTSDRRVKMLVLTPSGMELRERLQRRLLRGRAPLTGLTKGQQEALRDLLKQALPAASES